MMKLNPRSMNDEQEYNSMLVESIKNKLEIMDKII